jgi:hypothetical protein
MEMALILKPKAICVRATGGKTRSMAGAGKYCFRSEKMYEGEWRDNKHGNGTLYYADGAMYEGQYADGKKHGNGIYYYADGAIYQGEWRESKRHGTGTYTIGQNGSVLQLDGSG